MQSYIPASDNVTRAFKSLKNLQKEDADSTVNYSRSSALETDASGIAIAAALANIVALTPTYERYLLASQFTR